MTRQQPIIWQRHYADATHQRVLRVTSEHCGMPVTITQTGRFGFWSVRLGKTDLPICTTFLGEAIMRAEQYLEGTEP